EEIRGDGERAAGSIAIERAPTWRGGVNPVALDAASHLCIALLRSAGSELVDRPLLPFAVDRYRVVDAGREPRRARAQLRHLDADGASFDVLLLDGEGSLVAALEGWRLRRGRITALPLRQPT